MVFCCISLCLVYKEHTWIQIKIRKLKPLPKLHSCLYTYMTYLFIIHRVNIEFKYYLWKLLRWLLLYLHLDKGQSRCKVLYSPWFFLSWNNCFYDDSQYIFTVNISNNLGCKHISWLCYLCFDNLLLPFKPVTMMCISWIHYLCFDCILLSFQKAVKLM